MWNSSGDFPKWVAITAVIAEIISGVIAFAEVWDFVLAADIAATQYQRDRADEYPNVKEQLDMLWHAIDDGTVDKTSEFYTTLKSIKDSLPKP